MKWINFSPKQLESIRESTARINVWEGSVRSGKTIASLLRWLIYLREGPEGALLIAGRTERTIERNIIEPLYSICGPENIKYLCNRGEVYIFGRKVYLAGANDESKEANIRGMTLAGAYIDEATLIEENFFKQVLARLSIEGAQLFCATNPDSPLHWFKQDILDNPNLDKQVFKFYLTDNFSLGQAYINNLKKEYTGLWYKRFIEGKWVLAEGLIHPYNPDIHDIESHPKITQHILGIDFGTTNKTAILLAGIGTDNQLYLLDALSYTNTLVTDISVGITKWLREKRVKPKMILIDPSASQLILQLRRDNYLITPANNDVNKGLQMTSALFGKGIIKIMPQCQQVKEELSGYCWDDQASSKGLDKPIKKNDHFMDALRYLVMGTSSLWARELTKKNPQEESEQNANIPSSTSAFTTKQHLGKRLR